MLKLKLKPNQTGDTIVEVLLAVAILGFVIAGAAVAVNRNILLLEEHQERSQALRIAQSQIEDLRIYGGVNTACFNNTVDDTGTTTTVNPVTTDQSGGLQGTNPCYVARDGSAATTTTIPAYLISITDASSATFDVNITWVGPSGSNDSTMLEYRTQ